MFTIKINKIIRFAFLLSIFYWTYLFFTSDMLISHDSIGYEKLGILLQEQGWIAYFKTGPHTEPIYPFIISISMGIGKILSIGYQPVIKVVQLFFLFITQLLTLKILRFLKIRDILIALCILYLGFSPALINSALSVYSEIIVYPLILTIIIISVVKQPSVVGVYFGFVFLLLALTKGIFEIIAPIYLLFLFIHKRNLKTYIFIALITFYVLLGSYKFLNYKYNGNFVVTSRGGWSLYGNTARRMQPFTINKLFTALAYAPGEGVCKRIFDQESCRYWSFWKSDEFGYTKVSELEGQGEVNKKLISLSVELALRNPFQYAIFYGIEGTKMIFWESTKIGFVNYPKPLEALFNYQPFKDGIRFIMSLLTFLALLYLFRSKKPPILSFMLIIIIIYVAAYSFFFILTRYALPIAPLYLIIITYYFEQIKN